MKRVLVIIMVAVLMLCCGCGADVQGEVMSYDEMMRLPTVVTSIVDREMYTGLEDYIEQLREWNRPTAFVSGECLGKTHCLGIDKTGHIGGYTISKVKITYIAENFNELKLAVGDTVSIRQDYYIRPTDTDRMISYLVRNGINVILIGQSEREKEEVCEFVPYQGGEYEKCIGWYEVPMNPGEEYTFEISGPYEGTGQCGCFFIRPTSDESLLIKNDWYDLETDEDIMQITDDLYEYVLTRRHNKNDKE